MSLCLFITSQFWQYIPFALFLPMGNAHFPLWRLAWLFVITSWISHLHAEGSYWVHFIYMGYEVYEDEVLAVVLTSFLFFFFPPSLQEVSLSAGSHIASCIWETLTVSVGYTKVLPASGSLQHWTMLFIYRFSFFFFSFPASFNRLASVYQLDTTETFMLPDMKIIALPKSQKHRIDKVGKDFWRSSSPTPI